MDQKFDFSPMRVQRFGPMPISSVQMRCGFIIFVEYRDPETILRNSERAGHEIPREMNRFALEVIAEAEIAEHLEKSVMPRRVADILQIVVLAAGAHAALRARGARIVARLLAEKHILELHHAGIGEQQRRIVARDERTRRHDRMAVLAEKLQEARPDFRAGHHPQFGVAFHSSSVVSASKVDIKA